MVLERLLSGKAIVLLAHRSVLHIVGTQMALPSDAVLRGAPGIQPYRRAVPWQPEGQV